MEELMKKERDFVVPGDEIVKSMDYLPGKNCFREGESVFAKKLGLVSIKNRVISVIPLNAVYMPRDGDMVIGEIKEVLPTGWDVDINSVYSAYLPLGGVPEFIDSKTDPAKFYDIGDVIYAKISDVKQGSVYISLKDPMARKLKTGRIVRMNPAKIPRLIGKAGSMIDLIKRRTGCKINVGMNGLIWLEGEKEDLVIKAISLIEKNSHINGLTDRISKLLEGKE